MPETFHIRIATPEKLLVDADALSAQIPCKNGYIGVLPGHAALLSELGADELSYVAGDGRNHALTIHEGFLEILDNQVRIITEAAAPSARGDTGVT